MVIRIERDADLHMAQLMPLPLTVSCFSNIQIGFTFSILAHSGSPGKRAVITGVCVYMYRINSSLSVNKFFINLVLFSEDTDSWLSPLKDDLWG